MATYPVSALTNGTVIIAGRFKPKDDAALDSDDNSQPWWSAARQADTAASADMVFTANPTSDEGVVFTVGNGTLTGVTGTPGAGEFELKATLPLTLDSLVAAYNDLSSVNCTAESDGVDTVTFTTNGIGTEMNAYVTTETTDTDGVYAFDGTTFDDGTKATDGDGIFTLTVDPFVELVAAKAQSGLGTAADDICQIGAVSASAGTIVIRQLAVAAPDDSGVDDDDYISFMLVLRTSQSAN